MEGKVIGYKEHLPLPVLEEAVKSVLEGGKFSKEGILKRLQYYYYGKGTVKKTLMYTNRATEESNEVMRFLKEQVGSAEYNLLGEADRNVILFCLIAACYPILMDMLKIIADAFTMDKTVSKEHIRTKLFLTYAGEQSVSRALTVGLATIYEAGFIKRVRQGFYEKATFPPLSPITQGIYLYLWHLHNNKRRLLVDNIRRDPIFSYFDIDFNAVKESRGYYRKAFIE